MRTPCTDCLIFRQRVTLNFLRIEFYTRGLHEFSQKAPAAQPAFWILVGRPTHSKKSFLCLSWVWNLWLRIAHSIYSSPTKTFFWEDGSSDQNPTRRLRRWRFLGKFVQSACVELDSNEIQIYGVAKVQAIGTRPGRLGSATMKDTRVDKSRTRAWPRPHTVY